MVVDDTSEGRESLLRMFLAYYTDPANSSFSLWTSKSAIFFKGVFVSSDLKAMKEQKNSTIALLIR